MLGALDLISLFLNNLNEHLMLPWDAGDKMLYMTKMLAIIERDNTIS